MLERQEMMSEVENDMKGNDVIMIPHLDILVNLIPWGVFVGIFISISSVKIPANAPQGWAGRQTAFNL